MRIITLKMFSRPAKELEQIDLAIKKYNQCLTYCRQNGEDLAAIQLKQVIRGTSDIFKGVSAFNLDLSAYGAVFSGETDDQDGEKT